MLALVRCGRQAEALEAYQSAREVLMEELGTEPGAGLRDLHQQILGEDPATGYAGPGGAGGGSPCRGCRGSCRLRWRGLPAGERNWRR